MVQCRTTGLVVPQALIDTQAAPRPEQPPGDLDVLFARIGGTRIATDVQTIKTE